MSLSSRRGRAVCGAAVAATLLLVTSCGPAASTTGDDPPPQGQTSQPSGAPTESSPRDVPVTLAFAGDAHFAGRNAELLDSPDTAFGPISRTLSEADLSMVNLETAIMDSELAPEPKAYNFHAPPAAFDALRGAGIDVTSLGNNHGVDYGRAGLRHTLDAIERSGFPVVGIGADATEAYEPYTKRVRGTTVSFIGASHLLDYTYRNWTATGDSGGIASTKNMDRLLDSVTAAKKRADTVVVYLHWGEADNECPTPRMRRVAESLAQAGADAVVGTHAHVLVGAGYLGDTYVSYGLGNFLWWRNEAYSDDTGVLTLTLRQGEVSGAEFTPALIDSDGRPQPVTGQAKQRKQEAFADLRGCTELSAEPG